MENVFIFLIFCVILCGVFIFNAFVSTKPVLFAVIVTLIAVTGSLIGLFHTREVTEKTFFGYSSLITGDTTLCEAVVGYSECYQKATYRGFPFSATKTTYQSKGQSYTALAPGGLRSGGFGIIANLLIFTALGYLAAAGIQKFIPTD